MSTNVHLVIIVNLALKVGLKISEDSVQRQKDGETLLINQRADKLKAESRCHSTTLHASAGTAAQHQHKRHDTVACEGILPHDNLLPLNMLLHKGGTRLYSPFCPLLCIPISLIASTRLFDSLSHAHKPAVSNLPSPSQVPLNRLFSLLSFDLPPALFLAHLLLCLRIHWGFTTIEL